MVSHARIAVAALLALAFACIGAAGARAASFGVQKGTFQTSVRGAGTEAFRQAAGHPTSVSVEFQLNGEGGLGSSPVGQLQRLAVDLPLGMVIDPQAVGAKCEASAFEASPEPQCPAESRVGTDELTIYSAGSPGKDVQVSAPVYDLLQPPGLASDFGVYLPAGGGVPPEHLFLQGHISPSDYHEQLAMALPSGLDLSGSILKLESAHPGALLTLPSACASSMVWGLTVQALSGASESSIYESPGAQGCEKVPFAAQLSSKAQTNAYEQPTGLEIIASLPQEGSIFSADIAREHLTLPAGLTLNLPGLQGLQGCTAAQAAIGLEGASACPSTAQIGSAAITTPILPEALTGGIYLAAEAGATPGGTGTSKALYPVYLELESARYGTTLRLKGTIAAARGDGDLEVSFDEAPPLPLSQVSLDLGSPSSLLANPLACAEGTLEAALTPYTTLLAAPALSAALATTGCPSPLPFAPTQTATDASVKAGAATSFTIALARVPGEQGLSKFRSVLPRGLVARIPAAQACPELDASRGTCTPASEIGVGSIEAGAGSAPVALSGRLFLTGPFAGAPYGLALDVPVTAGPFKLGEVIVRVKLALDPSSGQLILEGGLPRIVQGIALRARRISLSFERAGFIYNPTDCRTFNTFTTLTGFTPGAAEGATRTLFSPLAIFGCGDLAFRPSVAALASASASPAAGANLEASVNLPAGDARVRSVVLQLPRQFTLRSSTLAQACAESTFDQNPQACPASSFVGSASASTPLLGSKLAGPAILVLHAQTNLPEVLLVLSADGVRLILAGSFRSAGGLTFLDFGSEPDLPVSSLSLSLPGGTHSALAFVPRGGVCPLPLTMPTTITAWSGRSVKLYTAVRQLGCGVRIVGHKVIGNVAYLTIQTFAAGRISASGPHLSTIYRHLRSAKRAIPLLVGLNAHARAGRRPLRIRLRVGFLPAAKGPSSAAYVNVKFH